MEIISDHSEPGTPNECGQLNRLFIDPGKGRHAVTGIRRRDIARLHRGLRARLSGEPHLKVLAFWRGRIRVLH